MHNGLNSSFQTKNCSLFHAQVSCRSALKIPGSVETTKSHGCKDRGSKLPIHFSQLLYVKVKNCGMVDSGGWAHNHWLSRGELGALRVKPLTPRCKHVVEFIVAGARSEPLVGGGNNDFTAYLSRTLENTVESEATLTSGSTDPTGLRLQWISQLPILMKRVLSLPGSV